MEKSDILQETEAFHKTQVYQLDDKSIRRGKANLALMMTLATSEHYDWFIGKYPNHNFFYFNGYRVYRRNVVQSKISVAQADIEKLTSLERKLRELNQTFSGYAYENHKSSEDIVKDQIITQIQNLTPLLVQDFLTVTKKKMHCIGEIYDEQEQLLTDIDLVTIYRMSNKFPGDDEALDRIYQDFGLDDDIFVPVKIDERTNWGITKCPKKDYPNEILPDDIERILFDDCNEILGEVHANRKDQTLTPHTRWYKGAHEHFGADLSIPGTLPHPLWNLSHIQMNKDKTILLTDDLYGAYKRQQDLQQRLDDTIKEQFESETKQNFFYKADANSKESMAFEEWLKNTVEGKVKEKDQDLFTEAQSKNPFKKHNTDFSDTELIYFTIRFLYLYPPHHAKPTDKSEIPRENRYGNFEIELVYDRVSVIASTIKSIAELFKCVSNLDNLDSSAFWTLQNNCLVKYAMALKDALFEVIEQEQEKENLKYQQIKNENEQAQKICWCSWFGGANTVPAVNWKSLRNRKIIYVLKTETAEAYSTAFKVYSELKHITDDLSFEYENEIHSSADFLRQAKNKYGLDFNSVEKEQKLNTDSLEEYKPEEDLDALKVPYLLAPIISNRSITLLYAPSGIGKTWFSLCIAQAMSNGQPLFHNASKHWAAQRPYCVVYIDSEMGEYNFKKRLHMIETSYRKDGAYPMKFKLVAGLDLNLADDDGADRDKVTKWLSDEGRAGRPVDMLILDNLSTLSGFNDTAKSWNNLFLWLKSLKEKTHHPCASIVVHHANKRGDQRGSSAKVATVDNVICLEKQDSIPHKDAATLHFLLKIEKGRDIEGTPKPFGVELVIPARNSKKGFACNIVAPSKSENKRTEEARAYLTGKKVIPQELIASLTGLSTGYIKQLSHRMKQDGSATDH